LADRDKPCLLYDRVRRRFLEMRSLAAVAGR